MSYSKDLKVRVSEYIELRATIESAGMQFSVGSLSNIGPGRPLGSYKINEDKLKSYIIENPDALSDEMYIKFGVTIAAISAALKQLNFT